MFVRYQHLERLGTSAVDGINVGEVYVFPKLDGTNGSLWVERSAAGGYELFAGSRNRVLTIDNDNAGFYNYMLGSNEESWAIYQFLFSYPHLRLFGEWLVPHTLKTYREDAWRHFYVFDVWNETEQRWLHYNEWSFLLKDTKVRYLAPLKIMRNPSFEDLYKCLETNVFLIQDGKGVGEGVVVKNYDFVNQWGNVVWAKIINNAFKEEHYKEMGAPVVGGSMTEEKIVDEYVTEHLVRKVQAKITNDHGAWSSKFIPQLLGVVYHDLITEEMWDILKKHNQPRIDFRMLQRLTIAKIKVIAPEVF